MTAGPGAQAPVNLRGRVPQTPEAQWGPWGLCLGVRGEGRGNKNSNNREHAKERHYVSGSTSNSLHGPSSSMPAAQTIDTTFSQMRELSF